MNTRPLFPLAAAACAALLLPSCVEWRIGQNIRESAEISTRLCVGKTADGRLYASRRALPAEPEKEWDFSPDWATDEKTTYYARVPLVEYKPSSTTVDWHLPYSDGSPSFKDPKPTGQSRLVAICGNKLYLLPEGCALPEDARRIYADDKLFDDPEGLLPRSCHHAPVHLRVNEVKHEISRRQGEGYTLASIAAAPFDYAIDPALSVVTTPVAVGLAGAFICVYYPIVTLGNRIAVWCSQPTPPPLENGERVGDSTAGTTQGAQQE